MSSARNRQRSSQPVSTKASTVALATALHRRGPRGAIRGPEGLPRSDERLREDISERLMQAYDIDSSEVTVQVQGGKVVLEGTVPTAT